VRRPIGIAGGRAGSSEASAGGSLSGRRWRAGVSAVADGHEMRPRDDLAPWAHQMTRPNSFVFVPLPISIGIAWQTFSKNYEVLRGYVPDAGVTAPTGCLATTGRKERPGRSIMVAVQSCPHRSCLRADGRARRRRGSPSATSSWSGLTMGTAAGPIVGVAAFLASCSARRSRACFCWRCSATFSTSVRRCRDRAITTGRRF
jgi:hypothetical protein